jgi:DnaA-homolog protein
MVMRQIALDIAMPGTATLDNFFPGPNSAVHAHLQRLVQGQQVPDALAVPTYLWGPQGSGKTHLLRAVEEGLRARGASAGRMDASGATPPEFDESWAMVLMDDVHLYGADQQHAAFGWFVQAHSLQRPVLAAGSSAPADLLLREDLRTRLGWGHIFLMQPLGEAQSRAVLRQAADARGLFLSDEVMDYTLRRFSRDLGSLLALLDELDRYALQTQRAITIPLIRSMLENT